MNAKVFMVLRILLGIFVIVFGINKFLNFLPPLEMSADASVYFGALINSKTMILIALVEIISGLALILNKFGALLAIILMSVSVNAVLFHAVLAPEGIGPAAVLLLLNIAILVGYKDKYIELLS